MFDLYFDDEILFVWFVGGNGGGTDAREEAFETFDAAELDDDDEVDAEDVEDERDDDEMKEIFAGPNGETEEYSCFLEFLSKFIVFFCCFEDTKVGFEVILLVICDELFDDCWEELTLTVDR